MDVSSLNKSFLEDMLRKFEQDNSIVVESFDEKPGTEIFQNFMSTVTKVNVLGKRKENEKIVDSAWALFRKIPPPKTQITEIMQADLIFKNEIVAYNQIIPNLQKYSRVKLAVPKCYYADNKQIILEDLSVNGYEMLKDKKKLEKYEYILVIKFLAQLHAANITLRLKEPDVYKSFSKGFVEAFDRKQSTTKYLFNSWLEKVIIYLQNLQQTNETKKVLKLLGEIKLIIFDKMTELISEKNEHCVYNHGDCWMNNMLFNKTDNSIKMLDLQMMRFTSVATDLSYFLYINLENEERVRNMDVILEKYLIELHKCMKNNGVEEVARKPYDMAWLKKEMNKYSIVGFVLGLWVKPAFYINKNASKNENIDTIHYEQELQKVLADFVISFFKDKKIDWKL